MAYPAQSVANEFLRLARRDGKPLTQMQLQKLIYFAYGWYLAITGKRLIDERIEAWQWGPVAPSVYNFFKRFGSSPITEPASQLVKIGNTVTRLPYTLEGDDFTEDQTAREVIDRVWEIYGQYSASQLSNMTHAPDSPWTRTPDKDVKGTDISDDLIRDYFMKLAAQRNEHQPALT